MDYLINFLDYYNYTIDAKEYLINSFELLLHNKKKEYDSIVNAYDKDKDINELIKKTSDLSKELNISEYTLYILLFISLSKKLKSYYIDMNYPLDIFYDSMEDLKYKNYECKNYYDVYGTCVPTWFIDFFTLKLFKIGILEFEIKKISDFNKEYEGMDPSTHIINIHIPKTGQRLDHDKVIDAYRRADIFFKKYFNEEYKGIYVCNSWMLFNRLDQYLDENSNIIKFKKDFTIIENNLFDDYQDSMRIFDRLYKGNVDEMPRKTRLQRAYIEMIKNNIPIGSGLGFFNISDVLKKR